MSRQRKLSVALVSLGCPKNLIDSEKMLAELAGAGMTVGAPMNEADVIVVNTCGFLSSARDESLGVIKEALEHKQKGSARRVVVAGCLASRDADKLYKLAPGIDAVVGVNNRDEIIAAVRGTRRFTHIDGCGKIAADAGRFRLTPRHTAYLRISEGCSQKCAFCTIPAIRGPLRSKPPKMVLDEARELIADGAAELNIIGQDTTSYGMDLDGGVNLAGLLRMLDGLDGLRWIRLLYAYPNRFSDALIEIIAGGKRIVPYVDIPLQHIDDAILRRMKRGITRDRTEKLLAKLRKNIPNLVIRTTFIVGFPGETQRRFRELLEFVKDFRFDALGVFEYSPEEGTPAAKFSGAVSAEVKAARAEEIMIAQQKIAFAKNRRKVGKPIEVLVDGVDAQGRCVGRYFGQAPDIDSLCILSKPHRTGKFYKGTVSGSDGYDLIVE